MFLEEDEGMNRKARSARAKAEEMEGRRSKLTMKNMLGGPLAWTRDEVQNQGRAREGLPQGRGVRYTKGREGKDRNREG